jgi:hypothetical protein
VRSALNYLLLDLRGAFGAGRHRVIERRPTRRKGWPSARWGAAGFRRCTPPASTLTLRPVLCSGSFRNGQGNSGLDETRPDPQRGSPKLRRGSL